MAISQALGNLPSQDWLTTQQIKQAAFILAMFQTLVKACEMFFSKTVSLLREYDQAETEKQNSDKPKIETKP